MKWLSEITDMDFKLVGGKAFNLAKLAKGFDVPDGFVITTDETLDEMAIIKSAKKLGKVAVRSSATAEDLPDASFAGQHDSFLDVTEDLIDSIRKCQASIDTDRAKFYREQKGITESKMAVIVQEMVNTDFAGVMFTVDPIHKKHILIEIVKGLGEKLVSGQVTPNTFFLDKDTLEVVQENVVFDMDKTILKELAKLGLKVQEYYGKPQDIEFCLEKDKIWLVQSRDITTL